MPKKTLTFTRACVEIAFIIFLFYANLLMGEFTVSNRHGKTWGAAFADIFTPQTFAIAMVSSVLGFIFFETLRHKA